MSDPRESNDIEGLPDSESETGPSLTPTDANTDPAEVERAERRIDSDSGLSPVIEQQGGAALANIGRRRGAERLFRD